MSWKQKLEDCYCKLKSVVASIDNRVTVLESQTITPIVENIIVGWGSASQDGVATTQSRGGMTVTRTNTGRYTVGFPAHPDGANYEVVFGVDEGLQRDVPKASVVSGSRTSTGFSMRITEDDNGAAADPFVDKPFSVMVLASKSVVTGLSYN